MKAFLKTLGLLSAIASSMSDTAHAQRPFERVRAGFSFGAIRTGGAALSIDSGPIINQNITAGFEVFSLSLVSVRALMWEQPANLSGFNGGAKLYFGFGSKLAVEPGAEIGWLYRMKNRIDLGAGIDLVVSNSIGGSIKIGAGLLL